MTGLPIKPCTLLSRRLTDLSLSLAHQRMHQMLPLRHSVQGQMMSKSHPPTLLQMLMVLPLLRANQLDSNKLLPCMNSRHSLIQHNIRLPVSSHSMLSRLVLQACLLHLAHMLSTPTQHSMDSIRATALVYGKALAQASRAGQAVVPPPCQICLAAVISRSCSSSCCSNWQPKQAFTWSRLLLSPQSCP